VVDSFRHKGLEEIYRTGTTRRIGIEYIGKCVRILQSLEAATQPEDMKRGWVQVPQPARQTA
jgi:proteic killer suppression protein